MGHHRFAVAAKSESGVESDISDQVESMNLNGLQRVTQAHQQLLEQTRRRLRDRISSRMGELLLLGHTMLNEYCELCEGIVMEDRQGVRSCITCDMVNRELSRRQGDRSAVFNNDDMNDLNGAVHEHSNMSRGSGASQSSAQFFSTDCPHVNLLESRSVNTAIEAVEDKLKWCAERLRSCENVEEVMKLYETIDCGIRILKNSTGV